LSEILSFGKLLLQVKSLATPTPNETALQRVSRQRGNRDDIVIRIDQLTDQVITDQVNYTFASGKKYIMREGNSIGAKDNPYVAFTRAPWTGSHMTSVRDRQFDPK
jgi:hypothetical protein